MDPLSIIAGIAGISQAGASLSRVLYDMISAARNAPKEMTDMARGISELSTILDELRRILRNGKDVYRRKLLRRVGNIKAVLAKRNDDDDKEDQNNATFARQQAENMVHVSYHHLRELASSAMKKAQSSTSDDDDEAIWLYDLVFSAAVTARDEADEEPTRQESQKKPKPNATARPASNDTVLRQGNALHSFQVLAQGSPPAPSVINELLSEWTTLTEDQFEGISTPEEKDEETEIKKAQSTTNDKTTQMIDFHDCVGRKSKFPFHLVQERSGMEQLIEEMFRNVDVIGPYVDLGRCDLLGSGGYIILPSLWKHAIHPDAVINMNMWPIDRPPTQSSNRRFSDGVQASPLPPPPVGALPSMRATVPPTSGSSEGAAIPQEPHGLVEGDIFQKRQTDIPDVEPSLKPELEVRVETRRSRHGLKNDPSQKLKFKNVTL
ncbi:Uu.00g108650.m01.CDS01 [Anthostomella pinea]|uniref:Uu.00g108650.m01.CDS01 n=1 Tax=Anthostomella pinea TaxID=933095 RepID=A0AAI8VEG2_9PEZI|nr:Uu.00g108650.m01.CDS01 [Anthostomella pinea]